MRIKEQLQMTSYDYHQHKQLEPNEVIIMGKQKRDSKLQFEVKEEWESYRERLGTEEIQRKEAEWQQYQKEKNL